MGLVSFGVSSTSYESSDEGFSTTSPERSGRSDGFPSVEMLKNMSFSPLPVLFPKLRNEQSISPPKSKSQSNHNTNQLSEMTFDAAFHHDYDTQSTFVPVKSNKAIYCIDPVEVSVGPLEAARVRCVNVVVNCYIYYL